MRRAGYGLLAALLISLSPLPAEADTVTVETAEGITEEMYIDTGGITGPLIPGGSFTSVIDEAMRSEETAGFLGKENLPDDVSFTPFDEKGKFGTMVFRKKDILASAFVINCEFTKDEGQGKILFQNMFKDAVLSEYTIKQLYDFNVSLITSENVLNGLFPELSAKLNRLWPNKPFPIPYNFFAVDYLQTEQLHRVQDSPRIYSTGLRAVLFVDGFAVPVYMKSYAMEYGDKYRFLFFIGEEGNHKIIKEGADLTAARSAK